MSRVPPICKGVDSFSMPIVSPSSISKDCRTTSVRRRRFNLTRRAEVAKMRKTGACMLCHVRKVVCSSQQWPCVSCLRYQTSRRPQNSPNKWIQCVPFSFSVKDLNIYEIGISTTHVGSWPKLMFKAYPNPPTTYGEIMSILPRLFAQTSPFFDAELQWDVHTLCSELALWMFDDDAQPASTSLVGVLSSSAFESLIYPFLGSGICKHLRLLIELTSALYCGGGQIVYIGRRSTDLWAIQTYVGTRVLQDLDAAVSHAFFKKASLEKAKALFLALLATIVAVGYSRAWNYAGDSSDIVLSESAHYVDAQKQLMRVLAHHLVLVGKRAHILDSSSSESQVVEDALCQWKRRATFEWTEMPRYNATDTSTSQNCDWISDKDSRCRYHLSRSHTVTESCRPAGGFGTCIKDVNFWHTNCGPSPMDQLLTSAEQLSLEPRPQEFLSNATEFDLLPVGGLACGCTSFSETTISTPECPPEEIFAGILCRCCHNVWLPYELWTGINVCRQCSLLLSGHVMIEDHSDDMPSIINKSGAGLDTLPTYDYFTSNDLGEINDSSTALGPNVSPAFDYALEQLVEVTSRLTSVNLLI